MLACFVAHVGLEKNTTQLVKYQPVLSIQPSNKVYVQYSIIMQYNTLDEFPLHPTPSLFPRVILLGILGGMCRPVVQILTLFQTKTYLASKIPTRFQT